MRDALIGRGIGRDKRFNKSKAFADGSVEKTISSINDYPIIRKLASALYKRDGHLHGAAIMIGAGFSRCAAQCSPGQLPMPLWNGISRTLATEIDLDRSSSASGSQPIKYTDPLRIAEEYRAYFGQAALNSRIRHEIADEARQPGLLYESLLKLPWSEVMTTNWDTLLERSAKDIHERHYKCVTRPSDLAWAHSPRIVKLHGTIGVTDTLIATQEDYRTYPAKFAPFVNFARQVFIENELCLLGFSGDDPNFLQWAGWIRDHLADHARKIYLVGALKLSAARRKHLESLNIAPVDLWEAVSQYAQDGDLKHETATQLFLNALREEGESYKEAYLWEPTRIDGPTALEDIKRIHQEPPYGASLLRGALDVLKTDRESYPGWLVCPSELRWKIESQLANPHPTERLIEALDPDDRAKILYEIAWRHKVVGDYVAPWLTEALLTVCDPDVPKSISKQQQLEICLVLLNNSRWSKTGVGEGETAVGDHTKVLRGRLQRHMTFFPDCATELAYHDALVARDALDYGGLEKVIDRIVGEDPVWKLRRAALFMELGRHDEGVQLVSEAYNDLLKAYHNGVRSIAVLSRLVWAHLILREVRSPGINSSLTPLPIDIRNIYRDSKCDPWDWIDDLRDAVNKLREQQLEAQTPIKPQFRQGHYEHNRDQRSPVSHQEVFLRLDWLTRVVGIPWRAGGIFSIGLLADVAGKLVCSGGVRIPLWDYTLAIRASSSATSKVIKDVFTRIAIARAPEETIHDLVERLRSAIDYGLGKIEQRKEEAAVYWISALQVLMESLARVSIRVSPDKAKDLFHWALAIGQRRDTLPFFHLYEPLGSLLTYTLESVPKSQQRELLGDALRFPLPNIAMKDVPGPWPNPVIGNPGERSAHADLSEQIAVLIGAAKQTGTAASAAALVRLWPLVQKEGFLTESERNHLADALWGVQPVYEKLPTDELVPHIFLRFPAPDTERVKALVTHVLFDRAIDILAGTIKPIRSFPSGEVFEATKIYRNIWVASGVAELQLRPSSDQAARLFKAIVTWRPLAENDDPLGLARMQLPRLIENMARALSDAIVPAMPMDQRGLTEFDKLCSFFEDVPEAFSALPAFVYFTHLDGEVAQVVGRTIQKAMRSKASREVAYATVALNTWLELPDNIASAERSKTVARLFLILESGWVTGFEYLLDCATKYAAHNSLSDEQWQTLKDAVEEVYRVTDYGTQDISPEKAITVSSARRACVKAAKVLHEKLPKYSTFPDIVDKAKTDPLPEVRFAANEEWSGD